MEPLVCLGRNEMTNKVRGMHHIGITVPDIEEGISFFKAVFGAVEVFRTGPFDVDQDFMENKLGAARHSKIRDLVFLRCGNGTSVELFEYEGESVSAPKRSSEVGGMHLCFEVDDVDAAADRLRDQGVELLDGPNLVDAGPLAGFNWIYFRAPWGLILEVASFTRLGYEDTSSERLWRSDDTLSAEP
ncbi:catechol 2,3-dioxygenase-like lactoylglutathione lyase family enzyme [Rhizobium sp. BK512]|uniref:VOC family protein n=1 Tax=Rhizobium sp. BK512 TaxID=2587010 RepID=UPI00182CECF9|nr:VOC family protein [Rhizobium sp. BK512]MBB3565038.1 catechol 2,3-dioxygenase-like lactoylglutathione lyase family enzyme [Rhizobium sp. BK512]